MSVSPQAPAASKSSTLPPPNLRLARFGDYAQIATLESTHGLESQPFEDWKGLWTGNPIWQRLDENWPIGWVLEDTAGQIVGSMMNVPSLYKFGGRDLVSANGRGWVVAPDYRGVALWLMGEYFNQRNAELFINTTVGPMAQQTFSQLSRRIPLGDWQTIAYWVTGYRGFAEKALQNFGMPARQLLAYPAGAALWVKDALSAKSLPDAPKAFTTGQAEHFDDRFDAFWEELVRQNPHKLLAARDSRSLCWHYAIPMRRKRLWILTASRGESLRAYCVVKRQDEPSGLRNRMRLVDYQSLETGVDLLPALLKASLDRCTAEGMFILEHLGCGLPKMKAFDSFAPYRKKLNYWPFYYHAADPEINSQLANSDVWDPSAFDGDVSFE
jgi:hypothetical protein